MSQVKPVYLMAGGSPRSPKSMAASLSRALNECGCPKPRVAYVGTASGDNPIFFAAMKSMLHDAGAGEVRLVHLAKAKADVAAAKRELEAADAVFLSGGEVEDGIRWLEKHGLIDFLKALREMGTVFCGVSAGSIMMGAHWVRWEDENDDSTAELFDCLGFIPATFDTHAEDEDWKELKTALRLQGPGARGYAIPSGGTAYYGADGQLAGLDKPLLCYVNSGGAVERAD